MKHFLALGFVSVLKVALSYGDIPQVMSYQDLVTDGSVNPVSDGSYTMRFRIYDAETGGTLEWDSGDRTVSLSCGVFNVRFAESPFPIPNLSFDEDYWLEVTFDGDLQSPRTRLASVGYAFMAGGIVPGTEVSGEVSSVSGEARVPLGETFKWVTNPEVGLTAHLTPRDPACRGVADHGGTRGSRSGRWIG